MNEDNSILSWGWSWVGLTLFAVVCIVPFVDSRVGRILGEQLGFYHSHYTSEERPPHRCLQTLVTAQADYRANDRDGNGVADFWHEDVSGLYALKNPQGFGIKLIEISVAAADAHPATDIEMLTQLGPKAGYLYKILRPPDESDWWDPDAFAFCTYPDVYGSSGTFTWIIGIDNVLYRKDLGRGGGVDVYPADPTAEGWEKVR